MNSHFEAPGSVCQAGLYVYPRSRHLTEAGVAVYMVQYEMTQYLVAESEVGFTECIRCEASSYPLAPLNHSNADRLRQLFPFTVPVPVLSHRRTFGVGDRLGIATPGHLRVFARYDALPILAQQSIRELTLTNRNFEEVLDCASFAVFREDFQRGFGADGDHLKTPEEISYALDCGYTMITLDCSEHIHNEAARMDEAALVACPSDPALDAVYLDRTFEICDSLQLRFSDEELKQAVLIYGDALDFIVGVYQDFIENRPVDFEISIDETQTPTTPLQHFFVANELKRRGVRFATMAPHFCGEFQKGVDYIGDLAQFGAEMKQHASIAAYFGYKISVHSGSDKFSVFPIVGQATGGHFHVKTAGTNWLEAMKLVAMKDPSLYRQIHAFARSVFNQASRYYHVTTDLSRIPDPTSLKDEDLVHLFEQNDARQLIHITYGLILTAKDDDGAPLFRDKLYRLWARYAEDYAQLLDAHIGKHMALLYQDIPAEA